MIYIFVFLHLQKGMRVLPPPHSQHTPLPTHLVTDKTKRSLLQISVNKLFSLYFKHFQRRDLHYSELWSGKCRGVQVEEYMYVGTQSRKSGLTYTKCSEHIESESNGQSLVLRPRPSVSCGETCEKVAPNWCARQNNSLDNDDEPVETHLTIIPS